MKKKKLVYEGSKDQGQGKKGITEAINELLPRKKSLVWNVLTVLDRANIEAQCGADSGDIFVKNTLD